MHPRNLSDNRHRSAAGDSRDRWGSVVARAMESRGEIGVHDPADVCVAQLVVRSERVLDPGGWSAGFTEAVGVKPAQVLGHAKATGDQRGSVERRHPIFTRKARDRGVVNPGLLRQLALRQLPGFELGLQPLVECARRGPRRTRRGIPVATWRLRLGHVQSTSHLRFVVHGPCVSSSEGPCSLARRLAVLRSVSVTTEAMGCR